MKYNQSFNIYKPTDFRWSPLHPPYFRDLHSPVILDSTTNSKSRSSSHSGSCSQVMGDRTEDGQAVWDDVSGNAAIVVVKKELSHKAK